MKALAFALAFVAIGATAQQLPLVAQPPFGCIRWSDGCNECEVDWTAGGEAKLVSCTERECVQKGEASCLEYDANTSPCAAVSCILPVCDEGQITVTAPGECCPSCVDDPALEACANKECPEKTKCEMVWPPCPAPEDGTQASGCVPVPTCVPANPCVDEDDVEHADGDSWGPPCMPMVCMNGQIVTMAIDCAPCSGVQHPAAEGECCGECEEFNPCEEHVCPADQKCVPEDVVCVQAPCYPEAKCVDEEECSTICPTVYDPVCTSDGVQYNNECEVQSAMCLSGEKMDYERGECEVDCSMVDCADPECPPGSMLVKLPGECCGTCESEDPLEHPCIATTCPVGHRCEEKEVNCVMAPCYPMAECVEATGTCVDEDDVEHAEGETWGPACMPSVCMNGEIATMVIDCAPCDGVMQPAAEGECCGTCMMPPAGCVSWFDGCNTCTVDWPSSDAVTDKDRPALPSLGCTEMACQVMKEPKCMKWADGPDCSTVRCAEPECADGTVPVTKIGECCATCDVDCSAVFCALPVCEEGTKAIKLPGDCCETCVTDVDCSAVACAMPMCEEGSKIVTPPGKCCPTCVPGMDCSLVRCALPECPPGTQAVTKPEECCPTSCEPVNPLEHPCIATTCPVGQRCEEKEVNCVMAPCYPMAECVEDIPDDCDMMCPALYDPVCTSDGVQYGNACEAQVAMCKTGEKMEYERGECEIDCSLVDCMDVECPPGVQLTTKPGECCATCESENPEPEMPPFGCSKWYDGCNTCSVQWPAPSDAQIFPAPMLACTKRMCFQKGATKCLEYDMDCSAVSCAAVVCDHGQFSVRGQCCPTCLPDPCGFACPEIHRPVCARVDGGFITFPNACEMAREVCKRHERSFFDEDGNVSMPSMSSASGDSSEPESSNSGDGDNETKSRGNLDVMIVDVLNNVAENDEVFDKAWDFVGRIPCADRPNDQVDPREPVTLPQPELDFSEIDTAEERQALLEQIADLAGVSPDRLRLLATRADDGSTILTLTIEPAQDETPDGGLGEEQSTTEVFAQLYSQQSPVLEQLGLQVPDTLKNTDQPAPSNSEDNGAASGMHTGLFLASLVSLVGAMFA